MCMCMELNDDLGVKDVKDGIPLFKCICHFII